MKRKPKHHRQTIPEKHVLAVTLREVARQVDRCALFETLPTVQELRVWAEQLALLARSMTDFVNTADAALLEGAIAGPGSAVGRKYPHGLSTRHRQRLH
jgi:hypothetical protein